MWAKVCSLVTARWRAQARQQPHRAYFPRPIWTPTKQGRHRRKSREKGQRDRERKRKKGERNVVFVKVAEQ